MSTQPSDSAERAIIDRISADAEAKAKPIIEDAEREARTILEEAAHEAEAAAGAIASDAEHDAARVREQAVAHARMEAKRILLRAREDAIEEVVAAVESAVAEIRGDASKYRRALAGLIAESLRAVDAPGTTLTFSASDKAIVEDGVVKEAFNALGHDPAERGVVIRYEDEDLGGGCVAVSPCGHIRFDNTLPRRLAEARARMRTVVAKELGDGRG